MMEDYERKLAELIMGWTYHEDDLASDEIVPDYRDEKGDFLMIADAWQPTEILDQAFMIADRMFDLGYEIMIDRDGHNWHVSFFKQVNETFTREFYDKDLTHCICDAAMDVFRSTLN
jgi:hypothetical protein